MGNEGWAGATREVGVVLVDEGVANVGTADNIGHGKLTGGGVVQLLVHERDGIVQGGVVHGEVRHLGDVVSNEHCGVRVEIPHGQVGRREMQVIGRK